MTLLITAVAAVVCTVLWYTHAEKDTYKLGTLSLMYWGASLMWFMDFVFEYAELKAEYFNQNFKDILNDALLGVTVVVIALIVWIIILLCRDPKGVFKKKYIDK